MRTAGIIKGDRLPPHSMECELGILGCILLDPVTCIPKCLEAIQSSQAFFDLRNRTVYDVLIGMMDEGHPIDLITVTMALKSRNQFEAMGGIEFLSALYDSTPSIHNLEFYLGDLQSLYNRRKIIRACAEATEMAYDMTISGDDVVDEIESKIMSSIHSRAMRTDKTMLELVREALSRAEEKMMLQGKCSGTPTGFYDLDKQTSGIHLGEVLVIAARPSTGKTSLAMNIADSIAINSGLPVGIFSYETLGEVLVERMLYSRSRVNGRRLAQFNGAVNEDLPKIKLAATALSKAPIHVCDDPNLNITQLKAKARRMVQQHKVKVFIVDYLQLISSNSRRATNRQLEFGEISRAFKVLALELNVAMVILSQLNRDTERENRKPKMSDLRESGDIEQDADSIFLLSQKPDPNNPDPDPSEPMTILVDVAKQRNGPKGPVYLTFLQEYTRFESQATNYK